MSCAAADLRKEAEWSPKSEERLLTHRQSLEWLLELLVFTQLNMAAKSDQLTFNT